MIELSAAIYCHICGKIIGYYRERRFSFLSWGVGRDYCSFKCLKKDAENWEKEKRV